MKKHFLYFLAAVTTVVFGVIVYSLAPYPGVLPNGSRVRSPVPLAAGAKRCAPSTVYYSERNEYTDAGEGVVDSSCSKWQLELQKAVEAGNLSSARTALANGANPNSPGDDYDLIRALPLAARTGNVEMARLLLDNGADVDFQHCCCMACYAPLTYAVDNGNVEMVRLLVARGADVNYEIANSDGMTLRDSAAAKGNQEILKILDEARMAKLVNIIR